MVNAYLIFEAYLNADKVCIDKKWLADPINHKWYLTVKNQSAQTLYFKLFNAIPNWDFGTTLPGTDDKELGAVSAGASKNFLIDMVREVPAGEITDEGNLTLKAYTDAGYSNEIASADLYVTIDIADTENWTDVEIFDFNDGTAQGWTLYGFSVDSSRSVEAGGYSLRGSTELKDMYISRTISIPNCTKCFLSFFYVVYIDYDDRVQNLRIYADEDMVFQYPSKLPEHDYWDKISVDLSPYKGESKLIKIVIYDVSTNNSMWIDRIVIAGKD